MAPQDSGTVDTNDATAAFQKILQLQASLIELAHDAFFVSLPLLKAANTNQE